ncbi:AbrB family transcriptional regulator [Halobacteriales archaeon QS_9_68_42]|nr:MAG: AbrB family transcriptional regulator [Halobacteriales archaeon QS_1_68_44]PSQ43202.1 MAG: AbrB family transcriptional regulator [Halobacteriales archaeon QS_9_68_42]
MGTPSSEANQIETFTLAVDDRGRVTLPKRVRKRLGIEPDDEIPASLVGSVLELNPRPSSNLETATAGRDDWEDTTPMDAGETLFGPMHR